MAFNLKANFQQIPKVKFSYNIGATLDIITGKYELGKYGEHILNGGLGNLTGAVGIGNNYKSTILHYMMLSAMSKFAESAAGTYDTEINISQARLKALALAIKEFNGEDILLNNRWTITDRSIYSGNEWFETLKTYMEEKVAASKEITRDSPFVGDDGNLLPMLVPTFTEIDSLTKFNTASTLNMQEKNEIGDSATNTLYMKEGQAKKQMINYLPTPVQRSNNYMLFSAHVGKNIPMDSYAPAVKKLQFLKHGDTMKGVTDDFTFLTTNCFHCQNATPLINDGTKGPEYPRDTSDNVKGDTDLFIVTLIQLRSKVGPTGIVTQLIVSQQEGVLPSLTEFHYIKTNDRFGLGGNMQNYYLELLPEEKLSRTTIRGKLDKNSMLRRAVLITTEMCQMKYLWHDLPKDLMCTPKELYDDLIKLGYDWSVLLNTRSWWTYNNDKQPIPYLSTMDLLNMRVGKYHPYWLNDDKKTIKKEFLKYMTPKE